MSLQCMWMSFMSIKYGNNLCYFILVQKSQLLKINKLNINYTTKTESKL